MFRAILSSSLVLALAGASPVPATAQTVDRTRDRGTGIPLSIFGTYIDQGELIVYPFFEYYRDGDYEYEAVDLGYVGTTERRGRYRAEEYLLFLAYGFTSRLAVEFEIATISASLDKSPLDTSAMPDRLEQSGLGDVEGQIRWRWNRETGTRPEYFSYAEVVVPAQQTKLLIGTTEWEYKFGTGVVRGLSWGTVTARAAVATSSGGGFELGEYAVEYLRRLSPRFRVFAALEGSEDEVEAITEVQVRLGRRVIVKLNNAFGVTSKAPDWAPEVGVMFSIPIG
jgi:hypothetical protein